MLEDEHVGALLPCAGRRLEEQIAKGGPEATDDEVVGDGPPPGQRKEPEALASGPPPEIGPDAGP